MSSRVLLRSTNVNYNLLLMIYYRSTSRIDTFFYRLHHTSRSNNFFFPSSLLRETRITLVTINYVPDMTFFTVIFPSVVC